MDKNNPKLKILYKCIQVNTSAIWQHMLHIQPTRVLISKPLGKKTNQESHKREYLLENGRFNPLGHDEPRSWPSINLPIKLTNQPSPKAVT